AQKSTQRYVEVAHAIGITPRQLALGWCNQVYGGTTSSSGATSMAQFKEDIDALSITLSEDTLTETATIFK
ncbi:aldo/keto reductase, partial [Pseudoalteromonas sp. S2893]|uniref:aldo/keto reductase n=1 Tax=Pseudoalteromonas sp. S2893 TaxID=579530 RepID=UPI001270D97A